ncbi:MAG: fused DSP-PTPase phosphatase/NAD kinase-like protein [Wenzhouxiangella sp.]
MKDLMTRSVPNACTPAKDRYCGGVPEVATLSALAAAGLRTVIDLRPASEWSGVDWRAAVHSAGLRFEQIAVDDVERIARPELERLWQLWTDEALHPMLVHCASGNRVGAALALAAHEVAGLDRSSALVLGEAAGLTRSREAVIARLHGR